MVYCKYNNPAANDETNITELYHNILLILCRKVTDQLFLI